MLKYVAPILAVSPAAELGEGATARDLERLGS